MASVRCLFNNNALPENVLSLDKPSTALLTRQGIWLAAFTVHLTPSVRQMQEGWVEDGAGGWRASPSPASLS